MPPLRELVQKLIVLLSPRERWQALGLFGLMLGGTLLELVGVGAIPAFVTLLADVSIMGDGGVKIAEVIEALFAETGNARRGGPSSSLELSAEASLPYHAVRAELGLAHDGGYVTPLDLAKVFELRPAPPPKAKASTPSIADTAEA